MKNIAPATAVNNPGHPRLSLRHSLSATDEQHSPAAAAAFTSGRYVICILSGLTDATPNGLNSLNLENSHPSLHTRLTNIPNSEIKPLRDSASHPGFAKLKSRNLTIPGSFRQEENSL